MKNFIKARSITKYIIIIMAILIGALIFTSCGKKAEVKKELSKIETDPENRTVSITCETNGKFADKSTMHCIVFAKGGMNKLAMFTAHCTPENFHDALVKTGGTPWNTTDDKLAAGEYTDGEMVDVTLTWKGQKEPVKLQDILTTDKGDADIDMRFSGNKKNTADCGSGCLMCLNSCWAGAISNAAYPFDFIDSGKLQMKLNKDKAPKDGTKVKFTFKFR